MEERDVKTEEYFEEEDTLEDFKNMKVELKYSDTTKCKEEKEQNVDDLKIIVKEESKELVGGVFFYS